MILAGDIGGTKTNLAVFTAEKGPHEPVVEETFASADYDGLEIIAQQFLSRTGMPIQAAGMDSSSEHPAVHLPGITVFLRRVPGLRVRSPR